MNRQAIFLSVALAATAAAHAQYVQTDFNPASGLGIDLGLGLFGSKNTHARVLDAWAELSKFDAERSYTVFTNADARDTPVFSPSSSKSLWRLGQLVYGDDYAGYRLEPFKFGQKNLFPQKER